MKTNIALLAALLPTPLAALHAADALAKKPNTVFIYSDDQPLRAMGSVDSFFSTPNIDRLAKESVVFDNAFVTTSICAVSRASFFTGQHSVRNGIASFDTPLSSAQMKQSYAGLLRQAGHRTAFLGKYEEGMRVPMMIRDPRLTASTCGQRSQMVLNIDIAPTIVALAGLPVPVGMQGINLSSILRDPKVQGRTDWYYEHDVGSESKGKPLPRCEGVRSERLKYIRYKDTQPLQEEFFDLDNDPLEEHNLAKQAAHTATLAKMRARCDELRRELR